MDKIENLHDLEYYGNIQVCLELALKWKKLKPDNKEIQELSRALIDISFYVIRIKKDWDANKIAVSDYRYDKNKALLQLQEIKNKYENLKKLDIN